VGRKLKEVEGRREGSIVVWWEELEERLRKRNIMLVWGSNRCCKRGVKRKEFDLKM